jgi:hypothetical protein
MFWIWHLFEIGCFGFGPSTVPGLTTIAVLAVLAAAHCSHLAVVLVWSDHQTRGARYYARPPGGRQRFKRWLAIHWLLLAPILTLLRWTIRPRFSQRRFLYQGVAGPAGACSPDSFRRAAAYGPKSDDVFVVTQMRSGTTWMQHLVFQVLTRGAGDLVADQTPLNAISPWIESLRTGEVGAAPRIGSERPARIIKTHLGVTLCPYSPEAKYIYVARHPVSCFASCADFVAGNLRGFAPGWDELEQWYKSQDLMWWGGWPGHVGDWQQRAGQAGNVLLVRYEDMTADLAAVAQRVAAFLGLKPLSTGELERVLHNCRLDTMRRHADLFEMHPPHLLQAADAFFGRGGADRYRDVPADVRQRILAWCQRDNAARGFRLEQLYPDLAGSPHSADCAATA